MPNSSVVLRATSVDVHLGGKRILAGVDLAVGQGEVLALLGANGSGKSTFVKAALGIVPVSAGRIEMFDRPVSSAPWSRIGYVPQRAPATTGIPTTACEVVRAGLLSKGRWRRASNAKALAALEMMGMEDRARQPVQEMSGGQQQRVLIARALVRQPDLLLLDEPTSGIDLGTIETFVETIDQTRQRGTAVVVVLHETEAFAHLIDRAVVLRRGCVVHDGPPPPARGGHAAADHVHAHPHLEAEPDSSLGLDLIGREP